MSILTPIVARSVAASVVGALLALGGCESPQQAVATTMTRAEQQATSPEAAIARLVEGNMRFVTGKSEQRDLPAQVRSSAPGQYPFAVVLSCMDSRTPPELVFDQGLGDIFAPRLAGNYVQADILGGMEFATKVAGARLIVVMGHTECGAVKGACDDVQMGNLTTVIQALRPAVNAVQTPAADRTSANPEFVLDVTIENVKLSVEKIRADSPILRELEQSGQIKIVGAMQSVSTGVVQFMQM